jgi:hypothetical protein
VFLGPAFRISFLILTFAAVMGVSAGMYSFTDSAAGGLVLALFAGTICRLTINHLTDKREVDSIPSTTSRYCVRHPICPDAAPGQERKILRDCA